MKRGVLLAISALTVMVAAAGRINGSWHGKLTLGMERLTIVFNISGDSCTMDSPDQAAFGIKAKLKRCTEDTLIVEVPSLQVCFEGSLEGEEVKGTFSQSGYNFPLVLKAGKPIYNRPQSPKAPFPYKTEDVVFENVTDSAVLGGTLTYPADFRKGETPVVLLVSGSGLQNRDEEAFAGHRPFAVIAHHLAVNGIASLRYDDRSVGKSSGDVKHATTATFAADAKAGLNFLRRRGEFGKVGLLGHSEGGTIAFILAGEGETDFIVSLAGAAVRGDKILVDQNRRMLVAQGVPEQIADDYGKALEKIYAYKSGNAFMTSKMIVLMAVTDAKVSLPEPLLQNLEKIVERNSEWLDYFVTYDPAQAVKNIKCPVMAINGSKDLQVSAEINLGALREMLPPKSGDVIKEYEGLNHMFQHCQSGTVAEYVRIEETISPEVLEDIVTFVKNCVKAAD